jgi:hypothetical protein
LLIDVPLYLAASVVRIGSMVFDVWNMTVWVCGINSHGAIQWVVSGSASFSWSSLERNTYEVWTVCCYVW